MGAKVALLGAVGIGIYIYGIIGTRSDAGLTADAPVPIKVNYAVRPTMHGGSRTDIYTRRLIALVASIDLKVPSHVGESAHFHLFYVSPCYANGNIVLLLTGDGTGVASDASVVVDYHSPFDRGVLASIQSWNHRILPVDPSGDFFEVLQSLGKRFVHSGGVRNSHNNAEQSSLM